MHASVTIKAMIHGYHVYKDIGSTVMNEKVAVEKELNNLVLSAKIFIGSDFTLLVHV